VYTLYRQGQRVGLYAPGATLEPDHSRGLLKKIFSYLALVAPEAGSAPSFALIVPLALAMGLQNAAARRLGVPDLTTTVLTLTLTGLAADSSLGGGENPNIGRRLAATAAMCLGAAAGALLLFRINVGSVLAVAVARLLGIAIASYRAWTSTEAWTVAG